MGPLLEAIMKLHWEMDTADSVTTGLNIFIVGDASKEEASSSQQLWELLYSNGAELDELSNKLTTDGKVLKKREKEKKRKRDTFFCVGVSTCSLRTRTHPPFHMIIKKL
jgi:hypothetical protein